MYQKGGGLNGGCALQAFHLQPISDKKESALLQSKKMPETATLSNITMDQIASLFINPWVSTLVDLWNLDCIQLKTWIKYEKMFPFFLRLS